MRLDLKGVGVSFVASNQELLYARVSGIDLRATTSAVRNTIELCVRTVQVRCLHKLVNANWKLPLPTFYSALRAVLLLPSIGVDGLTNTLPDVLLFLHEKLRRLGMSCCS